MSCRTGGRSSVVAAVRRQRDAGDQHRAERRPDGLGRERHGHGRPRTAAAPIGGADQLVDGDEAGHAAGRCAIARSSRRDEHRQQRRRRCCRRTPRRCRAGTSRPAPARSTTASVTIAAASSDEHDGAQQVDGDDDQPCGRAGRRARRRTARRAAAAATGAARPARPGTGRAVCEATSSGPAARAMPSPRLLTHDEASSQRKRRARAARARRPRPADLMAAATLLRAGTCGHADRPAATRQVAVIGRRSGGLHLLHRCGLEVEQRDGRGLRPELVVLLLSRSDEGLQVAHARAQPAVLGGEAAGSAGRCSGSRSAPWPCSRSLPEYGGTARR